MADQSKKEGAGPNGPLPSIGELLQASNWEDRLAEARARRAKVLGGAGEASVKPSAEKAAAKAAPKGAVVPLRSSDAAAEPAARVPWPKVGPGSPGSSGLDVLEMALRDRFEFGALPEHVPAEAPAIDRPKAPDRPAAQPAKAPEVRTPPAARPAAAPAERPEPESPVARQTERLALENRLPASSVVRPAAGTAAARPAPRRPEPSAAPRPTARPVGGPAEPPAGRSAPPGRPAAEPASRPASEVRRSARPLAAPAEPLVLADPMARPGGRPRRMGFVARVGAGFGLAVGLGFIFGAWFAASDRAPEVAGDVPEPAVVTTPAPAPPAEDVAVVAPSPSEPSEGSIAVAEAPPPASEAPPLLGPVPEVPQATAPVPDTAPDLRLPAEAAPGPSDAAGLAPAPRASDTALPAQPEAPQPEIAAAQDLVAPSRPNEAVESLALDKPLTQPAPLDGRPTAKLLPPESPRDAAFVPVAPAAPQPVALAALPPPGTAPAPDAAAGPPTPRTRPTTFQGEMPTLAAPGAADVAPSPAAAPPPAPAPVEPGSVADASRYRVHLHAPASLGPGVFEVASSVLGDSGFAVTDPIPVGFDVGSDHVRYFYERDAAAARQVARSLGGVARDFSTYRPRPSPGTIEVWLTAER